MFKNKMRMRIIQMNEAKSISEDGTITNCPSNLNLRKGISN
jgi:hypothetical protein